MGTEIYYFSGTGNSLFAAQQLQKRLPEAELIPMVSLLHRDKILTTSECPGFIFPIHALTIPLGYCQPKARPIFQPWINATVMSMPVLGN